MAYKGNEIVQVARTLLGKKYGSYYDGYRMDCTGIVCYCLNKTLGIKKSVIGGGCKQHWEYFTRESHKVTVLYKSSSRDTNKTGINLSASKVKAGDLMYKFNYDNSGNHHVVIATGNGIGTIDASGGAGVVRERTDYKWAFQDVDLWVRMYEDGATTSNTVTDEQLSQEVNGSGSTGETTTSPVINTTSPVSSTTSID